MSTMPNTLLAARKSAHIDVCLRESVEPAPSSFRRVHLQPKALPELNRADIQTSYEWLKKELALPFYIGSMTGGVELAGTINRHLAVAAQNARVGLALGSTRIILRDKSAYESFAVRNLCPDVPLLGNIGAVQLVNGVTVADIKKIVERLELDGMFLHLNVVQEGMHDHGDQSWSGIFQAIGELVDALPVPVFVKEVGCGMDSTTASTLLQLGVRGIDVAGRGGTSWPLVERLVAERSEIQKSSAFDDWGIDTVDALLACREAGLSSYYSSGGVRTGVDIIKSLVLGADLVSAALPFLAGAVESAEAVEQVLHNLHEEMTLAMLAVGVGSIKELKRVQFQIENGR
ncbi:type 2 isopentenyl-diphosphate Delta-isomerase [Candidatus Saccharibacteria bacterium]|nr:type 2 isopentenyl-diphosphate Delta-isomerase [Candidatus Saccharibacteria bacterium]